MGRYLEGGRRRAASDTGSSTSSSISTGSVWDTLVNRRSAQVRQSDVMERHRQWSVSGVVWAVHRGRVTGRRRQGKTRPGCRCRTAAGNVTRTEALTLTMRRELTLTKTER